MKAKKTKMKDVDAIMLRRANWLLEEARVENPEPDIAIKNIMRSLSNYTQFGNNWPSKRIKLNNPRMSKGAVEDLTANQFNVDQWHSNMINEHEKPLDAIWKEIILNANKWSPESVISEFKKWPMTTVTRTENKRLSSAWYNDDPKRRYRDANILIADELKSPNERKQKTSN